VNIGRSVIWLNKLIYRPRLKLVELKDQNETVVFSWFNT